MDMDPGEYEIFLQAIADIHLQDLQEIEARRNGEAREGQPRSDAEVAFDLYTEELNATTSYLADLNFARNLEFDLGIDAPLVEEEAQEEEEADNDEPEEATTEEAQEQESVASSDDSSSEELDHDHSQPATTTHTGSPWSWSWSSWISYFIRPASSAHPSASSSESISPTQVSTTAREPMATCLICDDHMPIRTSITVPCESSHDYCHSCVTRLFHRAVLDETLFPPRCDGVAIPLDLVRHLFTPEFLSTFANKSVEVGTRNRLYCHNARCSEFLGEAMDVPSPVPCTECFHMTCSACKGPAHPWYHPCSVDATSQHVIEMARAEGWQRCPSCHTMVELSTGCFHITCRCRAQFCYSCAAPWKTCECPQWDEVRLIERAEQRVHNELGLGVIVGDDDDGDDSDDDDDPEEDDDDEDGDDGDRWPMGNWHEAGLYDGYNYDEDESGDEGGDGEESEDEDEDEGEGEGGEDWINERVLSTVEYIREYYECGHPSWTFRRGGGACESCGDHYRAYLLLCNGCQMLACVPCQRNRL
ncbi:hypothetical protein BOTBODRAFT_480924 [Botryobasidium botryosum FD-172 SS1]|uniref:RBR-type E3 ubiquitin transferase n=1 Tax=Botryobasidium botryosum (strain FD-172 SS1) TaxID=930990 RepID=A0A067MTS3_BOTB1|nr:hypothetical protein BOTBODRAFT_480924 [Botryobasidium botryosum FD-172 SS1]